MRFLYTKKIFAVALLLALLAGGILLPTHQVSAWSCALFPCPNDLIEGFLEAMRTLFGTLIAWAASALQWFIILSQDPNVIEPEVIKNSWEIFRNFVNMFFILILIIMAFGTIFDVHNYTFKDLFVKFLVIALLINFSFAIGVYVIKIGNGLSGVFLETVSDVGTRFDPIERLHESLGLKIFSSVTAVAGFQLRTIINLLGQVVLALITFGALLAAAIFVIIRIPILWFLLILSPFAWFGMLLPSIKKETWDKWLSIFISWTFFLPLYLFFVMMAIYINAFKSQITTPSIPSEGSELLTNFGVIDLLFYIVVITILIGGISMSFKIGGLAANGAGAVMKWAQNQVKSKSGVASLQAGVKKAYEARAKDITERGWRVPFTNRRFGGAQKQREREATIAKVFGGETMRQEQEKTRSENLKKGLEQIKQLYPNINSADSKAMMDKASGAEKLAWAQYRAEKGFINVTEANETWKALGGAETAAGREYLKTAQQWLSQADVNTIYTGATGALDKAAVAQIRAEKGWTADTTEINATIAALGGPSSEAGKKYLEALEKSDFGKAFATPKDKVDHARSLPDTSAIKKRLYLNLARKNQLLEGGDIEKLLALTENDSKEDQKKAKEMAMQSIRNIARTAKARKDLLLRTTSKAIKQTLASYMIENGEVKDFDAVQAILDPTNGFKENDTKALEMYEKINKENPLLATEIEFRRSNSISPTVRTGMLGMRVEAEQTLKTAQPEQVAKASNDIWQNNSFAQALENEITYREARDGTSTKTVVDPRFPNNPVLTVHKGAGYRYLENLRQSADTTEKQKLISDIMRRKGFIT